MISNALNERSVEDWSLPTPSAFSVEEIAAVRDWVVDGGGMWLIADHMPMLGAASNLAAAFVIEFNNGFAIDTLSRGVTIFRRADGSLRDHAITTGRGDDERIDSVRTFTGHAFLADAFAEPLFVFRRPTVSLMPDVLREFDSNTQFVAVVGWYQETVRRLGAGRVAVYGDAAIFAAQVMGRAETFGEGFWRGHR